MRIAVFLPNWVGDLAMATPSLRALRNRFPNTTLVGIVRPHLTDVLKGTPWLDEEWFFDYRSPDPQFRHRALVRRLRREKVRLALFLTNSIRPAMLAWLAGVEERVGYVRYGRGPLLTLKVHPPRKEGRVLIRPVVDSYLYLTEVLGCPRQSQRLELTTTAAEEQLADRVWQRLGLRDDGRVITLNNSGAYGSGKLWPPEHFGLLAQHIASRADHDVLVMCGPTERRIAREIVRCANHPRVFSVIDERIDVDISLGMAKACIRRGRLMVSTDSGPRHVAAALGKPVVTMFGPTSPVWSANPTQRGANLVLDLDCIGCHRRVCPLGHHRCMRGLSVDMVHREVAMLLDEMDGDSDVQPDAGDKAPREPRPNAA